MLLAPDTNGLNVEGHGVWRGPPFNEQEIDEEPELVGPEANEIEFDDVAPPFDSGLPPEVKEYVGTPGGVLSMETERAGDGVELTPLRL